MPKLSDIRRIIPEEFDKEERGVAEKIAESYNEFADELYEVVNGQLDFDNLARYKAAVDITFNSAGDPVGNINIATNLTYVSMVLIGNAQNLSNSNARFSTSPYIGWTYQGGGIVKILYGIGFTPGVRYRLTLEIIQ